MGYRITEAERNHVAVTEEIEVRLQSPENSNKIQLVITDNTDEFDHVIDLPEYLFRYNNAENSLDMYDREFDTTVRVSNEKGLPLEEFKSLLVNGLGSMTQTLPGLRDTTGDGIGYKYMLTNDAKCANGYINNLILTRVNDNAQWTIPVNKIKELKANTIESYGLVHAHKDLKVDGITTLSGLLTVKDNTILNRNLNVEGDATVSGTLTITKGGLTVAEGKTTFKEVSIETGLTVSGTAEFKNGIKVPPSNTSNNAEETKSVFQNVKANGTEVGSLTVRTNSIVTKLSTTSGLVVTDDADIRGTTKLNITQISSGIITNSELEDSTIQNANINKSFISGFSGINATLENLQIRETSGYHNYTEFLDTITHNTEYSYVSEDLTSKNINVKNLNLSETFNISGVGKISGNLNIEGITNIQGTLNIKGSQSLDNTKIENAHIVSGEIGKENVKYGYIEKADISGVVIKTETVTTSNIDDSTIRDLEVTEVAKISNANIGNLTASEEVKFEKDIQVQGTIISNTIKNLEGREMIKLGDSVHVGNSEEPLVLESKFNDGSPDYKYNHIKVLIGNEEKYLAHMEDFESINGSGYVDRVSNQIINGTKEFLRPVITNAVYSREKDLKSSSFKDYHVIERAVDLNDPLFDNSKSSGIANEMPDNNTNDISYSGISGQVSGYQFTLVQYDQLRKDYQIALTASGLLSGYIFDQKASEEIKDRAQEEYTDLSGNFYKNELPEDNPENVSGYYVYISGELYRADEEYKIYSSFEEDDYQTSKSETTFDNRESFDPTLLDHSHKYYQSEDDRLTSELADAEKENGRLKEIAEKAQETVNKNLEDIRSVESSILSGERSISEAYKIVGLLHNYIVHYVKGDTPEDDPEKFDLSKWYLDSLIENDLRTIFVSHNTGNDEDARELIKILRDEPDSYISVTKNRISGLRSDVAGLQENLSENTTALDRAQTEFSTHTSDVLEKARDDKNVSETNLENSDYHIEELDRVIDSILVPNRDRAREREKIAKDNIEAKSKELQDATADYETATAKVEGTITEYNTKYEKYQVSLNKYFDAHYIYAATPQMGGLNWFEHSDLHTISTISKEKLNSPYLPKSFGEIPELIEPHRYRDFIAGLIDDIILDPTLEKIILVGNDDDELKIRSDALENKDEHIQATINGNNHMLANADDIILKDFAKGTANEVIGHVDSKYDDTVSGFEVKNWWNKIVSGYSGILIEEEPQSLTYSGRLFQLSSTNSKAIKIENISTPTDTDHYTINTEYLDNASGILDVTFDPSEDLINNGSNKLVSGMHLKVSGISGLDEFGKPITGFKQFPLTADNDILDETIYNEPWTDFDVYFSGYNIHATQLNHIFPNVIDYADNVDITSGIVKSYSELDVVESNSRYLASAIGVQTLFTEASNSISGIQYGVEQRLPKAPKETGRFMLSADVRVDLTGNVTSETYSWQGNNSLPAPTESGNEPTFEQKIEYIKDPENNGSLNGLYLEGGTKEDPVEYGLKLQVVDILPGEPDYWEPGTDAYENAHPRVNKRFQYVWTKIRL